MLLLNIPDIDDGKTLLPNIPDIDDGKTLLPNIPNIINIILFIIYHFPVILVCFTTISFRVTGSFLLSLMTLTIALSS